MDVATLVQIGVPIATVAAAWGGAKVALNGTRERVKAFETDLKEHKHDSATKHVKTVEQLSRIETKLDMLAPRTR